MEASAEIRSEEVYRFVIDTLSEFGADATISASDLSSLLKRNFKASESQIAGLVHRMCTSKGILERVSRGTYKLGGKRPIVEEFIYETDLLLQRLTSRVKSSILDLEPDELVKIQRYLKDIEALKGALRPKNTNTEVVEC
jgi:hypothetical protein